MAEVLDQTSDKKGVGPNMFRVHGITFVRTGNCVPCSGCYQSCVVGCPHGEEDADGNPHCTIHDTKSEGCRECSDIEERGVTHQVCADFPDHPWLSVIKTGMCSYKFRRVDGLSMKALPFMD